MAVARGIANWAHVQAPNQFGKYSIDLEISNKLAKELSKEKVSGLSKNDDGIWVMQFRSNAVMKNGGDAKPPKVIDALKNPIDCLVGNGSLVNVQYNISDWSFGKKSGRSAYLSGVQVLKLVAYEGGEDEFEEEEEFVTAEDLTEGNTEEVDEFDDDPFDD